MLRLIRLITVITLALSVILYATVRPAQADTPSVSDAFSISTDDGLSLTLSGDGQVVGLAMDGDPLPIIPAPALRMGRPAGGSAPRSALTSSSPTP